MQSANHNREIEARFLEIDRVDITEKLRRLGAKDLGQDLLEEIIFYDPQKKWLAEKKMVRIRAQRDGTFLTFKDSSKETVDGTVEIEFGISDAGKARDFLEAIGIRAFRRQQKRRHTFALGYAVITIDEHPKVPAYLEIEGPSEQALNDAAQALGLDWSRAHFESSRDIIENIYRIPLTSLSAYCFDEEIK